MLAKSPYEVPKRFRLPENGRESITTMKKSIQKSTKKNLLQPMKTNATNLGNSRISLTPRPEEMEMYEHTNDDHTEEPVQDEAVNRSTYTGAKEDQQLQSTMKDVSRLNISQEEEEREFKEHYQTLKEVERSQQMLEQLELEAFVEHET